MNDELHRIKSGWGGGTPSEEGSDAEVKRFWDLEIKPYFDSEERFLERHGLGAGYDPEYITRILWEHKLIEGLVKRGGPANVRRFSQKLMEHIRFKEEYLLKHFEKTLETKGSSAEPPEADPLNEPDSK